MLNSNIRRDYSRQSSVNRYIQALIIAGSIAVIAATGWFGYQWYTRRAEQKAYADLATTSESYKKAVASQDAEKIKDSERAFAAAAQKYKNSSLAPYFLSYQADALVQQDKKTEALAVMDQMISKIKKESPLYSYYALKRALMKLDATQEDMQQAGRQELANLAQDNSNPVRDMALYYNGLEASRQGDLEKAASNWSELVSKAKPDSQWRALAQEQLQ